MADGSISEPLTVTVQTALKITGLGNTTLYALIKDGKLVTSKVRGRTLIDYQSLKALVLGRSEAA